MRLTSSIVFAAVVLLASLVGFAGREAWAQAAPTPAPTPDQLMATAQQQLRAGDRAGAIASLRSAVALDPKHGSAGLLITTLHQDDRVEEAYALGDRYRREGPRNPRALFRFGWVLAFTGEIARAEAPARTREQAHEGRIRGRIVEHLEHRTQLGDNGHLQQARSPHQSGGDAVATQGRVELDERRRRAGQDRDAFPLPLPGGELGDALAHPGHFLGVRVVQRDDDLTATVLGCGSAQGVDAGVHRAQWTGNLIGQVEDPSSGAPIVNKGIARCGASACTAREVVGEVVDVGDTRATPLIDRLAGVAHGGHRMPVGKDLLEEHALRR